MNTHLISDSLLKGCKKEQAIQTLCTNRFWHTSKSRIQFIGVRFTLVVGFFILFQSICSANGYQDQFEKANTLYSEGEYQQAAQLYEQLLTTTGYSSALLYNLANSYAQLGNIGDAILAYERALRISPEDSDIIGNLQLVRKSSGLFIPESSKLDKLVQLFSIQQWALLGLITFATLTAFLLSTLRWSFSKMLNSSVLVLSSATLIISIFGSIMQYRSFNPSVVVAGNVKLLVSPFPDANSLGTIQQGRLVHVKKAHGDYFHIADETGRQGWLVKDAVEAVVAN